MFLNDNTLEIIADYFRMRPEEKLIFVEEINARQSELIFKSFLVYYETHKSPAELDYLELIAEKMEHEPEKYMIKFRNIFTAEAENNPEMVSFILKRLLDMVTEFLSSFAEGRDEDVVIKVLESIFVSDSYISSIREISGIDEESDETGN